MSTQPASAGGSLPRLGRPLALLAITALLNPYTLFLRDAGLVHWVAAFLIPCGGSLAAEACLRWLRRGAARAGDLAAALSAKAFALQAVLLCFQWADV
ncbi:hypothetical protein [Piscinibacter sp.]|uniref:hypothetical protein n=1 Tax=Piscinibacter sp. TaxID=1903157 RepID=UPI0039E72674